MSNLSIKLVTQDRMDLFCRNLTFDLYNHSKAKLANNAIRDTEYLELASLLFRLLIRLYFGCGGTKYASDKYIYVFLDESQHNEPTYSLYDDCEAQ